MNMKPAVRIAFMLMTFAWMALIFYLSSIPDLKSALPTVWDQVFRKLFHMVEFGVLCFLVYISVSGTRNALRIAVIVSVLYAISDEWHQSFVAHRYPSVLDVGFDGVGIALATAYIKKSHPPFGPGFFS